MVLDVNSAESVFCAMNKDAKVFAVAVEKDADFVFVLILEEDSAEDAAIAYRQPLQDAANLVSFFLRDDGIFDVDNLVGLVKVVWLKGLNAGAGAEGLQQDIVADRVDEGAESLWLADGVAITQSGKNAGEGFLTEFIDAIGREHAGAQLDPQKLLKIGDKVLLGRPVAVAQPVQIGLIKGEKLHVRPTRRVASIAL